MEELSEYECKVTEPNFYFLFFTRRIGRCALGLALIRRVSFMPDVRLCLGTGVELNELCFHVVKLV
jgi:hypothetical protein